MRCAIVTCATLGVLLGASGPAGAQDTWGNPFHGMSHLHRRTGNQNVHAVVVDLCAAGVSARTTGSDERRRTPSSFGALVGAQVAVNGDFFSYDTYGTDGLAMSGGALWPGSGDHGYVGPIAFGDRRAEIVHHGVVAGPEPWMREIVSGHPTILAGGAFMGDGGDPLCTNRHPRTSVGLSADKRQLIVAVVDGRASTRVGMTCAELAGLMAELGAHDAINMDGGGSSAMWMAGRGVLNNPSDGRERTVGNHLAIYATGGGPGVHCPNLAPVGYLDAAACDAVAGWAQDPDAPHSPIDVHLYFGGSAGTPGAVAVATRAASRREDLCAAIGSCDHGFWQRPPRSLMDGVERPVFAYGIDAMGGHNPLLGNSPLPLRCDPPALPLDPRAGVLRHVTSPSVMEAWRLSFAEVAPIDPAVIATYGRGRPFDGTPHLVRDPIDGAVYVIDGIARRHVTSPTAMAAWQFPWESVVDLAPDDLAAHPAADAWPDEPFLVRAAGDGAVYLVDRGVPDIDAPWLPVGVGAPDHEGRGRLGGDRIVTGGCSVGSGAGAHGAWRLALWVGLLALVVRRR